MDRVSDERLVQLADQAREFKARGMPNVGVPVDEALALVTELQERRQVRECVLAYRLPIFDGVPMWKEERVSCDGPRLRAIAEEVRLAHNGRKRKPRKWKRRDKRLRDEVRTLFGAVGDLTMRVYDVEEQVYDMQREARGDKL